MAPQFMCLSMIVSGRGDTKGPPSYGTLDGLASALQKENEAHDLSHIEQISLHVLTFQPKPQRGK